MLTAKRSFVSAEDSVSDRLQVLFKTSKWSDCTFAVGEPEELRVFKAHRVVLASSSPVFEAMLYGNLAETESINVTDIEPSAFNTMLQYIYTDTVELSSMEEACQTLYTSIKYMLPHLRHSCLQYMKSVLAPSNVIPTYEILEELGETGLYEACVATFKKFPVDLLLHPETHMKPSTLATIMKQDRLNISEPNLFKGAIQWATHECRERGIDESFENMRSILMEAEVLANIRFLVFTSTEFLNAPTLEILQRQEVNDLWFSILTLKNNNDMKVEVPNGFCSTTEPRKPTPMRQCYCIRSILKTSKVISGHDFHTMTKISANNPVLMCGIRFFSQIKPKMSSNHCNNIKLVKVYKENMEIKVMDEEGNLAAFATFNDTVEYNTKVTVVFPKGFKLIKDKKYSIHIRSMGSRMSNASMIEYPVAFLSETETTEGTSFVFYDYGKSTEKQFDMGFVDSILFSRS